MQEPRYPMVGPTADPDDLEQENVSYFRRNSNSDRPDMKQN
jgi:hypothetical protein